MEMRKVVSFGNSSFVVSLPKAWVTKNGLRKGDVVRIEESPNELIISAREEGKKKLTEITILCEAKPINELKTEILAAYVNNYNVIRLTGSNVKNISASLKQILYGLVGMEIIEETASTITAKDLLDLSEVSIDNTVRRMDILIRSILEDVTNPDSIDSIHERDKEINRLGLLSSRIFRTATDNPSVLKIFNTNYWNLFIARQVTVELEHIGDYLKRISRLLKESGKDSAKKQYFQLATRYREAMKIYYDKEKDKTYRLESETKKFMKDFDKMIEKNNDPNTIRTAENLKSMAKAIMNILRNVMERN
ncbi:phosphate uptake regulator PhoU [Candidatus Woesearchaeota archaeon]|nr:phosphate uptake regulator PhoU [Candidatus Woesearchaeota archaeon]